MAADDEPLAWSTREKLARALRADIFAGYLALPEIMTRSVKDLAQSTGAPALRRLVAEGVGGRSLLEVMIGLVAEMPPVRRSEWLVERLSEVAGLAWKPEPPPVEGPIPLPRAERAKIEKRFERTWERSITTRDDPPEDSEYLDVLDEEIARIERDHEDLAARVLTRRFPDRAGARTLSFRALADRESFGDGEKILRFFEKCLEIAWTTPGEPRAPVAEPQRTRRPFSPSEPWAEGDLVEHPKFGSGTVAFVEPGRVRIHFEGDAGHKVLALRR